MVAGLALRPRPRRRGALLVLAGDAGDSWPRRCSKSRNCSRRKRTSCSCRPSSAELRPASPHTFRWPFLTRYFRSNDLRPFGWYCVIVGAVCLVLARVGVISYMRVVALVLAVVFFVLGILYGMGKINCFTQSGAATRAPHHALIVLWVLALLCLIWARFQSAPRAEAFARLARDASVAMVDVPRKTSRLRFARAEAVVRMNTAARAALREATLPKGDALVAAQIAGIMAAKHTATLIPPGPSVAAGQGRRIASSGPTTARCASRRRPARRRRPASRWRRWWRPQSPR